MLNNGTKHFRLTPGVLSEERAKQFLQTIKLFDPNDERNKDLEHTYFGREQDKCWRIRRLLPKTKVVLEFKFTIKVCTAVNPITKEETWKDSKDVIGNITQYPRRYNWLAIDQGYKHFITDKVLEEILELSGEKLSPAGSLDF